MKVEVENALRANRKRQREIAELKQVRAALRSQANPDAKLIAMVEQELAALGVKLG